MVPEIRRKGTRGARIARIARVSHKPDASLPKADGGSEGAATPP
jgi:hypothetical protein